MAVVKLWGLSVSASLNSGPHRVQSWGSAAPSHGWFADNCLILAAAAASSPSRGLCLPARFSSVTTILSSHSLSPHWDFVCPHSYWGLKLTKRSRRLSDKAQIKLSLLISNTATQIELSVKRNKLLYFFFKFPVLKTPFFFCSSKVTSSDDQQDEPQWYSLYCGINAESSHWRSWNQRLGCKQTIYLTNYIFV